MREISFKAKRKDNGDWIEGFLTICDDRYFIVENGKVGCLCFDTLPKGHYVFMPYIEVDQSTVSQFTELTDKNGKKIFDGDILKAIAGNPVGEPIVAKIAVNLNDYELMWDIEHSYELEVIGNIHDNPELLENP